MQMVDLVNKSGSLLPPLALKGADDLEEEVHINPKMMMMMMMKQKQGIVSILGLHEIDHKTCGTTTYNKAVASLRRTLSADMLSKKWLEQSGLITPSSSFSSSHVPMKKIPSSQHIASILDSSDEEVDASSKNNRTQSDIWSSILSQKGDRGEDDASSYVHPQVKRSKSLLSEKSLEICTESLGSETGSDVFTSSDPVSDEEKEVEEDHEASQQQRGKVSEFVKNEEFEAAKYTPYSTTKKSAIARPFPPPLPSLARSEKSSLHMHSHRRDGRLVLEAVSIPSQNCFQAQRQDGRLLLTLINSTSDHLGVEEVPQSIEKEEEEEEFNIFKDEEIDENSKDADEMGMFFMEKQEEEPKVAGGIINVHGSTVLVTMKKIMERDINTTWMNNKYFNYKINNNNNINLMKQLDDVVEDEELEPIAAKKVNGTDLAVGQSLPPPPPVSGRQAATSLVNTYQYIWRAKPTMASVIINYNNPVVAKTSSGQTETVSRLNNSFHKMQKESLVVVRGNKADCTVPTLRGCKEPRRSLLMWEPHCIATS